MLSTIPAKKSAVAHKNAIVPPPLKQKRLDTITNLKRWLWFILALAFIDNVLVWYVLFTHL